MQNRLDRPLYVVSLLSLVLFAGSCNGSAGPAATSADLVISAPATLTVTPTTIAQSGMVTLAGFTVTNQGTGASNAYRIGYYLSADATITSADVLLSSSSGSVLAAGASASITGPTLTIPSATTPGAYFIGPLLDDQNGTSESNETNNFMSTALTVTLPRGAFYLIRESDDMLQRLDPTSLTLTNIGLLGVGYAFGDCAWDPANSTLYMVEGRSLNTLYKINITTGAATVVGVHGVTDLFALAYYPPSNTLFGASSANGNLYRFNLTTGAATLVGATGTGSINGLAWDSARLQLVALTANLSAANLYTVNVVTGAATLLVATLGIDNNGLTYDPIIDRLLAADYGGNVYQYNPASSYARTTPLTGQGQHTCIAYVPCRNKD